MSSLGHITRCRGEVREVLLLLVYTFFTILQLGKVTKDNFANSNKFHKHLYTVYSVVDLCQIGR